MLASQTVASATMSDGNDLVLTRRGEEWMIRVGGRVLMSSRAHGSERALAEQSLRRSPRAQAVLVGGLGLGYTLRAVLDHAQPSTQVTVAELVPELVDWNRTHLRHLHEDALSDPRCHVATGDVFITLERSREAFDVILLDVDNGPVAFSRDENRRLYLAEGLRACHDALRPGGVLTVWSASPSPQFERRVQLAGFSLEVVPVPVRPGSGGRHTLFIGTRRAGA